MSVYGDYLLEGFFKSKLDKVQDLINKNQLQKAKKLLEKINPKQNEVELYNKLKDKIAELEYKNEYEDILDVVNKVVKWWDKPNDVWENSHYFQILSVAVSDSKFINHIKSKISKTDLLKDLLIKLFGRDNIDNTFKNQIKSKIKETDKLFIFNTNDDYVAFVNLSNNKIYDIVDFKHINETTLKEIGGDFFDENIIKDVLKKENIHFN